MTHVIQSSLSSQALRGGRLLPALLGSNTVSRACVTELSCQDGGLGLFRLVHLLHVFERLAGLVPERVISVGSGRGFHETILALLFPEAEVLAIDLMKQVHAFERDNLKCVQGSILDAQFVGDIEKADFLFSIECLEHIEKDKDAFMAMASLVRPGGYFYLQLPFANAFERADPALCASEMSQFGHCTPGYDREQLAGMAMEAGLCVLDIGNVFWAPLQPMFWAAVERFGPQVISPYALQLMDLLQTDIRVEFGLHRGQCLGIKMLAFRPSNSTCM